MTTECQKCYCMVNSRKAVDDDDDDDDESISCVRPLLQLQTVMSVLNDDMLCTHGGQKLRFKDTFKQYLKKCRISVEEWESLAADRPCWCSMLRDGVSLFESQRRADREFVILSVRSTRSIRLTNVETNYKCDICVRHCKSRISFSATHAVTTKLRPVRALSSNSKDNATTILTQINLQYRKNPLKTTNQAS